MTAPHRATEPGLDVEPTAESPVADPSSDEAGPDRLVHSSLHIMFATVLTGGLGYLFWALAARRWDAASVGTANAVVALCTALSLVVHLGPAALTIERLPRWEGTSGWAPRVWTAVLGSAVLSAVVALPVPWLAARRLPVLGDPVGATAFVLGCAAWSAMSVTNYVFVALRRSEQMSLQNAGISVLKLALLAAAVPIWSSGSLPVLLAWAVSALVGTVVTLVWQLPRAGFPLGLPRLVRPGLSGLRSAVGHHATSVGGVLTPFVLPPLVALLISPTQNAYFAVAWMVGSLFFMVAPAVGGALFAEGAHGSDLSAAARKAVRLIALLLGGPMLVMLVLGYWVLSIFGSDYAHYGYLVLAVLVVSALPDAVNNVAVGVYRATGRLRRAAAVNLGMATVAVAGTCLFARHHGIVAVAISWGTAQLLGAVVTFPDVRRAVRTP